MKDNTTSMPQNNGRAKLNKKILIAILVVLAVVVATCITLISLRFTVWNRKVTVSAEQVAEEQKSIVSWDISKPVDSVEITVSHGGNVSHIIKITDTSTLAKGTYEVPTFYGRQTITLTANWDCWSTTKQTTVDVFASTYNIAPLTATMPVTLFSLNLDSITNNGTIPTFVWFKRSEAWNYQKLPQGVYTMPVASYTDITGNKNQTEIYSKTSSWIKELYKINPSSHFNLFYNDYFAYGWLQATVANGIPEANYNVTLLSDGTASFQYFNKNYNDENALQNYETMKNKYAKLKEQIANRKCYDEFSSGFAIDANTIREYAYVMAKEESNVQWWLTRVNGTIATNNSNMYADVQQSISNGDVFVKDLKTMLTSLSSEQQAKLKTLYNFSDTMFEKAEQENKQVMVILGTWTDTENATNFDAYVKAVISYYGDDYVYYYKGHPKNPTNSVAGKLQKLKGLGLIDVDSTIPAELIFFFNPQAIAIGYQSSTFTSLNDEQSAGVWNVKKDSFAESYKNNLETYFSMADRNASYGSLVKNDNTVLIEFRDTTTADIALFDATANKLSVYKIVDGEYVLQNN